MPMISRVLCGVFILSASLLWGGRGGYAEERESTSAFSAPLATDKRILHALNRLTFGPRPGDLEQVRAMGLDAWLDLQLHPERIAENSVVPETLRPLTSLPRDVSELILDFPPPAMAEQIVKARANGQWPAWLQELPTREQFARVSQIYEKRFASLMLSEEERWERLNGLLTSSQMQMLRTATPAEKLTLIRSLPAEQREEVLIVLPRPLRAELLNVASDETRRILLAIFTPPSSVIHYDLTSNKLYRAIYSDRQLQEILVDFWFNHFNVLFSKAADTYMVTAYEREAIRPHVLGKFRDLLLATAQSPAMLFYLDNWQSHAETSSRARISQSPPLAAQVGGLNENYARELLELHTLGVNGGYTQRDVVEVARCFTGWTINDPWHEGAFVFNARLHDTGEKTVLGARIPGGGGISDGLQVLNLLAQQPATARFVARKLAQQFVADDPPAGLVEKMASVFLASDGDIREVLTAMLNSTEFWSEGAYRAKIKSPLEFVVSAVRALKADVHAAYWLATAIGSLGEPLYLKVEPTGYPATSDKWLTSASLLERFRFAQRLANNEIPQVRVELTPDLQNPDYTFRELSRQLLPQETVSASTRAAIIDSPTPFTFSQIAALLVGSPEFQRH